ncbi:MAG TPA: prepilin-type N-terminal cleavage/methylation domain-containing protein [Thermoleophilia bacterium]|nr:prepilin-type N-terminal cleavage/methylation domain-containing protein [Thermoleophilia bacterium]
MSTSSRAATPPAARRLRFHHGFTLIELLVSMVLSLLLLLAVMPAGLAFVGLETEDAGRNIWLLQAEVASERLRMDLGAATTAGANSGPNAPMLQAEDKRIVFVSTSPFDRSAQVICWELTGASLMRRSVPWIGQVPPVVGFSDSKTMLEEVGAGSRFTPTEARHLEGETADSAPAMDDIRAIGLSLVRRSERAAEMASISYAPIGVGR